MKGAEASHNPTKEPTPQGTGHFAEWALPLLCANCPQGDLLELGCGSGRDLRFLVRHGFRVVGVDLAHDAVVRARSANSLLPASRRARAKIVEAEMIAHLKGLPRSSVDVVYAVAAYQHLTRNELDGLFVQIHRVLRPRGLHLYCVQDTSDPHFASEGSDKVGHRRGGSHDLPCRYFSPDLCEQLASGKFSRIHSHRHSSSHTLCIADRQTDDPARTVALK